MDLANLFQEIKEEIAKMEAKITKVKEKISEAQTEQLKLIRQRNLNQTEKEEQEKEIEHHKQVIKQLCAQLAQLNDQEKILLCKREIPPMGRFSAVNFRL